MPQDEVNFVERKTIMSQQPFQQRPYSAQQEQPTTVHPSTEQRQQHYSYQQLEPRFYPIPPPRPMPPKSRIPWQVYAIGFGFLAAAIVFVIYHILLLMLAM